MSTTSMDEESCVSGISRDDGEDCKRTRSLHSIDNHMISSDSSQSRSHPHRRHDTAGPPKSAMTPSSSHRQSQQQQQQQQQVPLSPRSREYLRLRVNARERQRMHDMNVALDALRRAMPYAQGPAVKKLSKMNTLLLARNYILLLTRTLDELRRLLVSPQAMNPGGVSDVIGRQGLAGGITGHGRSRGAVTPIEHQNRLEAALRGLIDGTEINAEQQRYAEELVRREQIQLRQEQEHSLMTAMTKSSGKIRNRKQQDLKEVRSFDSEISPPEVRKTNRKRKLERSDSPDSPSRDTILRKSPSIVDDKDVVASSTDEKSRPVNYLTKYQDERLLQYAMPPPSTSGPLMMMASARLPEMAAVGFSPAAAHQALSSGSSAAVAAAMMSHMISGPFPSCPCPHCADSRPTYIMPISLVTAATAAHQQHRF